MDRKTDVVIMSDPPENALLECNAGTCETLDQINSKQDYYVQGC